MNPERRELLHRIYARLLEVYGPQGWWPADSPFEVIVGAILTQNTAWKNVERAITALKERGLLNPAVILETDPGQLALTIRASGYYNQKARKLRDFCEHLHRRWRGDLNGFLCRDMKELRSELLTLWGIGPETADCIVLYAAFLPSFVVDVYTLRIFSRHGWVKEKTSYDELRGFFMDVLDPDVAFFQEFHGLLVRTGHLFCRRKPACASCPLQGWASDGITALVG